MATDFSRTLSLLRQEMGISQRKAAAALGISQALLSHYENGIREPGLAFVARACDFYHVSADFLLGRTNSRDGSIIEAGELYDASDEKGTLKGSILATLQKKLVVNTTGVLFDLLGKCGDRAAITAAGDYLSTALYTLLRHYYRLQFSPAVETAVKPAHRNPKRAQREAGRQTAQVGIGTKSQQALQLQQEQNKQVRKRRSRVRKQADAKRLYALKQQQKREKHKGH